jgi:O-antigen/teichoic acid export membrane protein
MTNVVGRLIKGSMWLTLSRAVVNGLATLSTLVLAWYLAPSDFGIVALASSMLVIITTVTELSLGQALIRHKAPEDSHFSAVWTMNVTRGLVLCLIFAACAYPVSVLYKEPRLFGVMLALGFSVLLTGLGNPRLIMLQRDLIFWQEFALSVSQKLTGLITAVTIAVIYHSYWALVASALVAQSTRAIASYFVLPFRPRITFQHLRELFSFSLWLTAGQVVNTINWRFDQLVIGKVLGGTALGYYTYGDDLAKLPTSEVTAPLTQTIFPSFSTIRHDPQRLAAAYQRVQGLVTAVALPAGIGVAVIAEPLVRLALGEKWTPVIFIIRALASIYAIQTLGSLVQPLGMAKGATRLLFVRSVQMFCVRLPIVLTGLLLYGLHGAVLCRVLTGLIGAFVNMSLVRRLIGVSVLKQLSANLRALASAAFMAAGVTIISSYMIHTTNKLALAMQLLILILSGAVLYCGTTFALWLMMKRPTGPEAEIRMILTQVMAKVRLA